MLAISMLAQAIPKSERAELPCDPVAGVCAVTGLPGQVLPREKCIPETFNNQDLFMASAHPWIGVDAFQVLKHKHLRTRSWMVSGARPKLTWLTRDLARPMILGKWPASPWGAYVTFAGKKHGALRVVVNEGRCAHWTVEEQQADCTSIPLCRKIYERMEEAQEHGVGKGAMISLDVSAKAMAKIGPAFWLVFRQWAQIYAQSGMWRLLVWLLPSAEAKEGIEDENV